jgi:hypothetical protein
VRANLKNPPRIYTQVAIEQLTEAAVAAVGINSAPMTKVGRQLGR